MDGKQAYKLWKDAHKVNLRVYTDEQMFEIGFNYANDISRILEERSELLEQVDALKNTVEVLANKNTKKVKVKKHE